MQLGELIARFEDPGIAAETLLSLDDLALTARVTQTASENDLTPGEVAVMAVDRFVARASDEDWLTIVGLMARTDDPGQIFLRRVLQQSLM